MTVADEVPPGLKPQDTIIYLLGQLRGQMSALVASSQAQAEINAENRREHEEFRRDIATIQATQPVRVSPWAKAGVVVAIPASLVALIGFIVTYFQAR